MSQIKVSITVPIYNAEKELPRCINSLIKQTLQDIEIILVDDGSSDSSGHVCDEYAQKDPRIKVFHKVNGGSAEARQLGLANSLGEYYTVCDADDWVEPSMYEELYNRGIKDKADIVLSNHYINYPNGKQIGSPTYEYINQDKYILDIMYHKASANTWNKLFKMSTIRDHDIIYEKDINLGEDALFLYKLLLHPLKISTINKPFYHYHRDINSNSYTNNVTLKTVEQNKYVWEWKRAHYIDEKYDRAHKYSTINLAFTTIRANDASREFFKSIVQNVSYVDVAKYKLFSIKTFLIMTTKVFGLNFGRFIYRNLYKFYYK